MAIWTDSFDEPNWQHVTSRGIEAWALRSNRLHPRVRDFLQPLFDSTMGLALSTVRILVYPKNTSWLGTAVWVAGDKIVFRQGTLNGEYARWRMAGRPESSPYTSNKVIDLATESGMKVLCHELRHVWQSRSWPWWKSWGLFGWGIVKSLWYEKRWYSHRQVQQEIDAGEFMNGPAAEYIHSRREHLSDFEDLR